MLMTESNLGWHFCAIGWSRPNVYDFSQDQPREH